MKVALVIPARMHSTRLPRKMMADLCGRPLIIRVLERIQGFGLPCDIMVATDHDEIFKVVEEVGCLVEMTDPKHPSGTDRVAEIANRHPEYLHLINIQGDEPFVKKEHVLQLLQLLETPGVEIASLCTAISDLSDIHNPNNVKVVLNQMNKAMYFSRATIPYVREIQPDFTYLKHLGMYGFTREMIMKLSSLPISALEQIEKLEQLRWLDHGCEITMAITSQSTIGIDSEEDLHNARILYNKLKTN